VRIPVCRREPFREDVRWDSIAPRRFMTLFRTGISSGGVGEDYHRRRFHLLFRRLRRNR